VALWPNAGQALLIIEVSRSHTTTHQSRLGCSGRVINSSQRHLTTHNTHCTSHKHPCRPRDS